MTKGVAIGDLLNWAGKKQRNQWGKRINQILLKREGQVLRAPWLNGNQTGGSRSQALQQSAWKQENFLSSLSACHMSKSWVLTTADTFTISFHFSFKLYCFADILLELNILIITNPISNKLPFVLIFQRHTDRLPPQLGWSAFWRPSYSSSQVCVHLELHDKIGN